MIQSLGSTLLCPHPLPPPCPPAGCGGSRLEATPAPRILDPKVSRPLCPGAELETHKLEGGHPKHPWSELAPLVWGLPPLPAPGRDPAWPSAKPTVGLCKQAGPPILSNPPCPQRGLPCSCRNIDSDKPGRHIRCPGGVRRSVAQLATRSPVAMGSSYVGPGWARGEPRALGSPLCHRGGWGQSAFAKGR